MNKLGLSIQEMLERIDSKETDSIARTLLKRYKTLDKFLTKASTTDISIVAFWWGLWIGDHDIMIDHVLDPYWAYQWACQIGHREIMIDRVQHSGAAFRWACMIGDHEVMKTRVTDPHLRAVWNLLFPDYPIDEIDTLH